MKTRYISSDTATLYIGAKYKIQLLWGDRIKVDENDIKDGRVKCTGRGKTGYISKDDYGEESLLEIYIIDVGQGDGVLVKCPDPNKSKLGKHLLIDGGYMRAKQPTKKNAADFVDWKFHREYGLDKITIDDMIVSHCDADHYGGLWDLVNQNPEIRKEIDCDEVEVKNFYHAGVSWWKIKKGSSRNLGIEENNRLKTIITDKSSIINRLDKNKYPQIQGEYHNFLQTFVNSQPNANINFVGFETGTTENVYLPNYELGNSDVVIEILGPLYHKENGKIELNDLGSHSKNTNGNSILLSLKYKSFKILLTGDLNEKSQKKLMEQHPPFKFASDVTKACHHGSHDVSFNFLQQINAAATVISSGDNEKHAHPRANLLTMSALSGYRVDGDDTIISPLIYSTEIARSVRIGIPKSGKINLPADNDPSNDTVIENIKDLKITYERNDAGDLKPQTKTKKLDKLTLVDGIVYGLINIRTDGNRILFAVRNEKGNGWETSVLHSRFDPIT